MEQDRLIREIARVRATRSARPENGKRKANHDGDDVVVDSDRRVRAVTAHSSPSAALPRGRVRRTREFCFFILLRGDYAAVISIGHEFASVDGTGKRRRRRRREEKREEEEEKEVAATLFIASAKCNGIACLSLSLSFSLTSESCSCTRRRTFGQLNPDAGATTGVAATCRGPPLRRGE